MQKKNSMKLRDLDQMDDLIDQEFSSDKYAKVGARLVGRKRQDQSEYMTKHNPMLGQASPNRGRKMPKISEQLTGIVRSEETRKKISDTRLRLGLGNSWTGKQRPDHSEKMSGKNNPMYGKTIVTHCDHCGKDINGASNFKRWHGDNCKHK